MSQIAGVIDAEGARPPASQHMTWKLQLQGAERLISRILALNH